FKLWNCTPAVGTCQFISVSYDRRKTRTPPPYNERHARLRAAGDQMDCFDRRDVVNPAKCSKRSIPMYCCRSMKAHTDGIDVLTVMQTGVASWSPRRRRRSLDHVFYPGRLKA